MSDQEAIEKISNDVENTIKECGVLAIRSMPKFKQALQLATGYRALRKLIDDNFVTWALMPLRGTRLGFLTDMDKEPAEKQYSIQVIKDCSIEALIRGFYLTGNEFNIIAGSFYGAKNGYERLVFEFPGVRNVILQPGVPQAAGDKTALVPYTATWFQDGEVQRIECLQTKDVDFRIPVRVNSGMGADGVIGKAERKMYFRIYKRLYGSTFGATDGEVGDGAIDTTGVPAPSPVPAGAVEGKRHPIGEKRKYSINSEKKQPPGGELGANGGTTTVAKGAAAGATNASIPPPSATAPAAAPADLVDRSRLLQMLDEVSQDWADLANGDRIIATWSEDQCRSAFTWAEACLSDGPMAIQSKRPAHTLISARQPGDDA
jgi:hypothetical protein